MWIFGVALIALVAADVFLTVFHPHAHSGPLSRVVIRTVWWFSGWMKRLNEPRRDRLMALVGPFIAISTLSAWALLLLGGFALIYASAIEHLIFTEVRSARWVEALYFSGMVFSTMGLGDVVPGAGWLRLLAIVQASAGFVLVSVGVTYILAVYQAYRQAATLAFDIHTMFGSDGSTAGSSGVRRVLRGIDRFGSWAGTVSRQLNAVTTASTQYPILQYFRPPDHRKSALVQAGSLLSLFEAIDDSADVGFHLDEHPNLYSLRNATHAYLAEVAYFFEQDAGDLPEGPRDRARERHQRLLHELGYDVDEA